LKKLIKDVQEKFEADNRDLTKGIDEDPDFAPWDKPTRNPT